MSLLLGAMCWSVEWSVIVAFPGHTHLLIADLTHYLLVSYADNFSKQFGPRSSLIKMLGLNRSQTVEHSDGIPERIFR